MWEVATTGALDDGKAPALRPALRDLSSKVCENQG
jgi:hypothetical protein